MSIVLRFIVVHSPIIISLASVVISLWAKISNNKNIRKQYQRQLFGDMYNDLLQIFRTTHAGWEFFNECRFQKRLNDKEIRQYFKQYSDELRASLTDLSEKINNNTNLIDGEQNAKLSKLIDIYDKEAEKFRSISIGEKLDSRPGKTNVSILSSMDYLKFKRQENM